MSNVLFAGDLHLDHKAITKYRKQFRDQQDHLDHIEKAYHDRVTKRDKCYFTGDAVFSEDAARRIAKWPGQKVLVVGNHDTEHVSMKILADCFDAVHGLVKYKEFWISHAPIHPAELRGKVNIHGHVHASTVDDCRYFNTSLENTDFKLISLFEIRDIIRQRKEFYDKIYSGIGEFAKKANILNIQTESLFYDCAHRIPVGLK